MQTLSVNNIEYKMIKLLGRGKGGYSYLVEKGGKQYVLKQIHHEPCAYYTFGNKIEAERNDYGRLLDAGIRIPKMMILKMAEQAKSAGLNIDYFPTNFVVQEGLIYYVDYECNHYMDEWNFENWGIKYWSKTPEFLEYLKNSLFGDDVII